MATLIYEMRQGEEGASVKKILICCFLLLLSIVIFGCRPLKETAQLVKPEDVGMDSTRLDRLDSVVNTAISRGDFPGAVLLVGRKGSVVFRKSYGYKQWIPERRPMTPDTIFDMASITKPVATAPAVLLLLEQGKLRLWDQVTDFIPVFKPFVEMEEGREKKIGGVRI